MKKNNFYALFIKQYIFFTIVVMILLFMFYQIELQLEKNVLKIPDRNRKIGQLTELKNNEFDQLKIQKLFGTSGYFEILDL